MSSAFLFFFCSPLQRARQTASIIAAQGRTPKPIYISLLAEYDWGVIQGMTKAEIGKRYPEILQRLQRDFHHAIIPGAEGMSGLFYRVRLFYALLSRIAGKRSGQEKVNPILIVSHGRFLQAFIIYFLKYNYKEFWPFSLAPASLTILQGDFQRTRRLRLFNDTCHLSGMSRNVDEQNENMKI
jgi:broad specificity phosphatase PhoE